MIHHVHPIPPADGTPWVAYEIQALQDGEWTAVQAGLVEDLHGPVRAPFAEDTGAYRVLWVADGGKTSMVTAEQRIGRSHHNGFSYGGR